MKQAQGANFRFVNYLIKESSLLVKDFVSSDEISLNIELNATVPSSGEDVMPQLEIVLDAKDKDEKFSVRMKIVGFFEADRIVEQLQLNRFMAFNAPAILFPYVRAFLSSISAQAGMQPVIIPTINLHDLGKELLERMNADNNAASTDA